MKKVLFAMLSVVAVNAPTADTKITCPDGPIRGKTQCFNHNTQQWEYRSNPLSGSRLSKGRQEDTVEVLPLPPVPSKKHPTTYFDHHTGQWVRVQAN